MRDLRGSEILSLSGGQAGDVAQQVDQAREQLRRVNETMTALAEIEVVGSDETGMITATVSGVGKLRSVYVSPHAVRELDNVMLGEAACQAIHAARAAAGEHLARSLSDATGEEMTDLSTAEFPEDPMAGVRELLQG